MLSNLALLKAIIDNTSEYFVLLSPEHKILVFNKAYEELHKSKLNTHMKQDDDFRKYVHPQNYEAYMDIFARGLNGESSVIQRKIHLDSGHIWMEFKMKPIYDQSGLVVGLTLTSSEITHLKQTQIELIHKHDILRGIMDSSKDNIVVLDMDYKVLALNKVAVSQYHRAYGVKLKIGDDYRININPINVKVLDETFTKALGGESSVFELEREFPDGKIWVEVKVDPVYTHGNKLLGVSRIIRDIDKRKKAELTLLESEEKFRKILESASVPILILDKNMNIVIVNPETEIVFGYNHDELYNYNLHKLIPQRFHDAHAAYEHSYFHNPKSYRMGMNRQISAVRKDGKEIIVEVALNYFTIKSEQFIIAILQDITQRVRSEQKISMQLKRFETIAWLQSHKVRKPLANILGLISIIDAEKEKSYNQEYLDYLKESAEELDKIIQQIVDHSADLEDYFEETGFRDQQIR